MAASFASHTKHPREYVDGYGAEHGRLPESIAIWVGPEGISRRQK